jgi:hypothetical protein
MTVEEWIMLITVSMMHANPNKSAWQTIFLSVRLLRRQNQTLFTSLLAKSL